MQTLNEKGEILKRALDSLPLKKTSYAWVVKREFSKISKILKEGGTFEAIFEHLAAHGLLPENGDHAKLRQAFRREEKRRFGVKEVNKTYDTQKNVSAQNSIKKTATAFNPIFQQAAEPPEEETEEERVARIRKQLGTVVETGTGRIIKHSDGSFEFD